MRIRATADNWSHRWINLLQSYSCLEKLMLLEGLLSQSRGNQPPAKIKQRAFSNLYFRLTSSVESARNARLPRGTAEKQTTGWPQMWPQHAVVSALPLAGAEWRLGAGRARRLAPQRGRWIKRLFISLVSCGGPGRAVLPVWHVAFVTGRCARQYFCLSDYPTTGSCAVKVFFF